MKLTKFMREAFVNAAMQDVPQVDYNEQAAKLVNDHLDKLYAKAFKGRDRKADMASEECSGWLASASLGTPHGLRSVYTTCGWGSWNSLQDNPALWKSLSELGEKAQEQRAKHKTLEDKLWAVANSVTTRKALADALPEFEKYLPLDEAKATKMLPAVTNVVAEFASAGWPKQEPKKEAKAETKPAAKKATKKVSAK